MAAKFDSVGHMSICPYEEHTKLQLVIEAHSMVQRPTHKSMRQTRLELPVTAAQLKKLRDDIDFVLSQK